MFSSLCQIWCIVIHLCGSRAFSFRQPFKRFFAFNITYHPYFIVIQLFLDHWQNHLFVNFLEIIQWRTFFTIHCKRNNFSYNNWVQIQVHIHELKTETTHTYHIHSIQVLFHSQHIGSLALTLWKCGFNFKFNNLWALCSWKVNINERKGPTIVTTCFCIYWCKTWSSTSKSWIFEDLGAKLCICIWMIKKNLITNWSKNNQYVLLWLTTHWLTMC